MDDLDLSTGVLRSLPAQVRPATYWFWSEIPSRPQAARDLRAIADAGFSTVMIQARLGLPRERYLSPDYLRAYRAAVEEAAALGLHVGVYDDYNWASGHAGGRTVQGAGHLRERHVFWSTSTVEGDGARVATVSEIESAWFDGLGEAGRAWVYEGGIRAWDEWELVSAVAHPRGRFALGDVVDVTDHARCAGRRDGCEVSIAAPAAVPGDWVVTAFVSARCATSRLVNYLDPRTAERFIEVGYGPYLEACEGLIGDPIRSFSFDHPYGGFYDWAQRRGPVANSLMWDEGFARELRDVPLGRWLLATVADDATDSERLRCAFFAAYARRGIEAFFGTLGAWARDHGVELTGHELLAHTGGWDLTGAFPDLDARTNFGLDYFALDRHRTRTLVDAMNFEAQLSPVIGDSVARAHGRGRCIVEQYAARDESLGHYAAGYWELAADELRLQTLRLHVLGCRQLLMHACSVSDGTPADADVLTNPRFDFPPAVNFEPWFEHFPALAAQTAAVSAFIDGAQPIRRVALVYPLHTAWAERHGHVHGRLVGEWAQLLTRAGVGFDLVDDRALAGAAVDDGELRIGEHGYAVVVLAGVTTVPEAGMVTALERLAAAGGVVLATAPLPCRSAAGDGTTGDDDASLGARVAAVVSEPVGDEVPASVPETIARLHAAVAIDAGEGPGTLWRWTGHVTGDRAAIRVVVLNDGPGRRRVRVVADGPVDAWRLTTDGRAPWPWSDAEGAVTVDLEPEEIACLQLAPADGPSPGLVTCDGFVSALARDGDVLVVQTETDAPIVVRGADGTRVTHEGHGRASASGPPLELDAGWTLQAGYGPRAPIDPARGWEQQGWPTFSGVGTYRCTFDAPAAGAADAVTGDRRQLTLPAVACAVRAQLNGVALGARAWGPYRFALPDGLLRTTSNALELRVTSSAANRYYAGTPYADGLQPSGLCAVPVIESAPRVHRIALTPNDV